MRKWHPHVIVFGYSDIGPSRDETQVRCEVLARLDVISGYLAISKHKDQNIKELNVSFELQKGNFRGSRQQNF